MNTSTQQLARLIDRKASCWAAQAAFAAKHCGDAGEDTTLLAPNCSGKPIAGDQLQALEKELSPFRADDRARVWPSPMRRRCQSRYCCETLLQEILSSTVAAKEN